MDKQTLRKEYLQIRNNIQDKEIKSKIIINKLTQSKEYQQANVIGLYKSLKTEVNTDDLITYSLNIGKKVLLPKTIDNNLAFYQIKSLKEELIKSKFGVLEPKANSDNYVDKTDIDLIIVPGVCFDKAKNRLGFGKGYYDHFLANTSIKKIGICFDEQVSNNNIKTNSNDIKMDLIITDKRII